jgi:hypothetical protein
MIPTTVRIASIETSLAYSERSTRSASAGETSVRDVDLALGIAHEFERPLAREVVAEDDLPQVHDVRE